HGGARHSAAPRDAPPYPCRVWVDFQRQYGAMAQFADLEIVDTDFRRNDLRGGSLDPNRLQVLDRQYLPEPSNRAGPEEDQANDADRDVGHQAGEYQRQSERHDHGPRGRRWKLETIFYVLFDRHPVNSAADHIHGQEHYYPDCVHEVPVP